MSSEDNPVSVCFRLSDFLSVLTLLGSGLEPPSAGLLPAPHTLRITYKGNSDKLVLRIREETHETKARIKTYDSEELILYNMNFCNKVILNAEPIIEFWKSADLLSDYIQVSG